MSDQLQFAFMGNPPKLACINQIITGRFVMYAIDENYNRISINSTDPPLAAANEQFHSVGHAEARANAMGYKIKLINYDNPGVTIVLTNELYTIEESQLSFNSQDELIQYITEHHLTVRLLKNEID